MKIPEEIAEKLEEENSELYHFPEDKELKTALEEQEMDLNDDLSFLPDKMRKKLEEIFDSKTPLVED
jgi:hypothetical protein